MMRAAVPAYLGNNFTEAAPGHRFGLYYAGWETDFTATKTQKTLAVKDTCALPRHSQQLLAALIARQQGIAELAENLLALPLIATSPFATGLGNEHPLENGFSFLTPYGLPYLPGSGVKGVIRRAAEELASGAWGDTHSWTTEVIRRLFGPGEEDPTRDDDPHQGALIFWDVLPKTPKDTLAVEIMTPHLGKYYQGEDHGRTTPNTSLTPNPIPFLAVPAGSAFLFHVACNPARLDDPQMRDNWQPRVEAAFDHAARWLGFGAKTATGYGRMAIDEKASAARREAREKAAAAERARQHAEEKTRQLEAMSPLDRSIQEVIDARPQGQAAYKAIFNEFKKNRWQGDDARQVAERLRQQMQAEKLWREKSDKKKPEKDENYQMTLTVLAALRA